MTTSDVNISMVLIGVLVATLTSLISGSIWFGPKTLYPVWMKARGVISGQLNSAPNPVKLFGGTFLAVFLQTLTLGIVIIQLEIRGPELNVLGGVGIGLLLGFGIGACASLPHRLFAGESFKVWLIECSNDVINLAIAGAIITAIG